jgi:glycosyltransferase involved in cell wall biosynthesis
MNVRCFESLFSSENWSDGQLEVLLLESNKNSLWAYDERIRVIIPRDQFNFHRFLNIGVRESSGDIIAFCNNDIVFTHGWYTAIRRVKDDHPEFTCFSPLDRSYPLMKEEVLPSSTDYYIGWDNKKHFAAWCFLWERIVFDTIGPFDESFDFYYADDDELQTLRSFAIPNVVVTSSEVKHLSQQVTLKTNRQDSHIITNRENYPLTREEIKRGYEWLWEDDRFYRGYQCMKLKWGNERMRGRIHRFLDRHKFLFKSPITRILYNRKVNSLLCLLTGIKQ